MQYAHYDAATGQFKGFYSDDIYDVIPEPNLPLTDEEWNALLGKNIRYADGKLEVIPPKAPTYAELRAMEYPSYEEQFDLLYHGGYDAWKAAITAIKEKYPKE